MTDFDRKVALLEKLRAKKKGASTDSTRAESPRRGTIPKADRSGPLPLSFGQERIWLLDRLSPGGNAFNMPSPLRLRGALDTDALRRAIDTLVERHEALRTTFAEVDGLPRQVIHAPEDAGISLEIIDLSDLPEDERRERADTTREKITTGPFDLEKGPLYRAVLLKLSEDEHHLVQVIHHIISDGWSSGLLFRELSQLLAAYSKGEASPLEPPLDPLPIQYADYAAWQRERLSGEYLDKLVGYWRESLEDSAQTLALPTDRPRPAVSKNRGGFVDAKVPKRLVDRLETIAREERTSLFMILLAVFDILMARLAGQEDVLVGSPVAGRQRLETEGLVGFFLNTLILRTQVDLEKDFRSLLRDVRATVLGATEHQEIPFEKLLEELRPERHLSQNPFFQVMFNMTNLPDQSTELPGLVVEGLGIGDISSKFDLTLYVSENAKSENARLFLYVSYDAELFDRARMNEMLGQYVALLEQVAAHPDRPVAEADLVTGAARAVLPDPKAPLSAAWRGTIAAAMSEHAAERPDAPAVIDVAGTTTYRQHFERSGRIAQRLVDQGLERGDVVAIWAHRSAPVVDALVGVLRAGGAFTMLDPQYPVGRLLDYVELSAPRGLVVLEEAGPIPDEVQAALDARCVDKAAEDDAGDRRVTLPKSGEEPLPDVETPSEADLVEIGADDLAYVAFTSGSTGKPKAILGRHHSLTHFLPWLSERFGFARDDRHGLLSALSHDPLHRDVFMPLAYGATIVVPAPERIGEPGYLAKWVDEEKLTVLNLVPAMLQLLVGTAAADTSLDTVRGVYTVGDVLTRHDVDALYRIAPNARCVNYYGSTETQRAVSYVEVPRDAATTLDPDSERGTGGLAKAALPLGRGLDGGVQLLVLDARGRQAGVGEPGEIHVRSHLIARGYSDPELTRERFVPNPFAEDGSRLYKTGDLGRYLPNGDVEFLGRADSQVKIRGFRIELQEIEVVLEAHPAISESAVVVRGEGDGRRLAAYLVAAKTVAEDDRPSNRELRAHLTATLPDYMVPTAIVWLDALPLTRTGKLDRRNLPEPTTVVEEGEKEPPRDDTERTIAAIWTRWLEIEEIGRDDDFFELGGHSLLATQVLAGLRKDLGVELPLRVFFERPTVADLALEVTRLQTETLGADDVGGLLDEIEGLSDEELEALLAEEDD